MVYWLTFSIFLLIPLSETCDVGESAIYIADNEKLISNIPDNSCLARCAKLKKCTGVLSNQNSCLLIDETNYFGLLKTDKFFLKQCITGLRNSILVREWANRTMIDKTQKITKTISKIKCILECENEKNFICRSIMYYPQSNDCLLNSETSTQASVKFNSNDYNVFYSEISSIKGRMQCQNQFLSVDYMENQLKGDIVLFSEPNMDRCISRCDQCDYLAYNEQFSECFLVNNTNNGNMLDFVNDDYQILENLCKTNNHNTKNCSLSQSMFISYSNSSLKLHCLEKCISDPSCFFAYLNDPKDKDCSYSSERSKSPVVIERYCSAVNPIPIDASVLFDDMGGCLKHNTSDITVNNINYVDCMQLCVTHPARLCQAISHDKSKCILHVTDIHRGFKKSNSCSSFSLNVIDTSTKSNETVKPKTPVHAASSKILETIDIEKNNLSENDVQVETICNLGNIVANIKTKQYANGEVFVRNAHQNCSARIDRNGLARLSINYRDSVCPTSKVNDLIEAVIVVSRNLSDSHLITMFDQLYKIRCDYSNRKTTKTVSSVMSLREPAYSAIEMSGNVHINPINVELRSKRENSKIHSTFVGQKLNLVFKSSTPLNYTVQKCWATSKDAKESITLIEKGCPAPHAKEFVLRGELKNTKSGFVLPLRSFRFKNGETVQIKCLLKTCEKCSQVSCGNRNRRNTFENKDDGREELVEAELSFEPLNKNMRTCFNKIAVIATFSTIFFLIMIQLIYIFYCCMHQKQF